MNEIIVDFDEMRMHVAHTTDTYRDLRWSSDGVLEWHSGSNSWYALGEYYQQKYQDRLLAKELLE